MTTQTDVLKIRFDTDGDGKVRASIAGVERGMDKVDRKTQDAAKHLTKLKGIYAALGTIAAATFLVRTIADFEKLQASLVTVTGSIQSATQAFKKLQAFAAETPFQLQEVVDAFIKLTALGLEPSMAALRSYGNTASAMGKSLDQFIEAIADAATGEFERLKEFGIKSRQQGDQVSFTFQKVTTTVRKNATEIEKYLRGLGENQFASGMLQQMDTLGGAWSNLEDAVSAFAKSAGDSGLSGILKDITNEASSLIRTLAGVPTPMSKLVDNLNKLRVKKASPATQFGWYGLFGNIDAEIKLARDEINKALIATGGPVGLRVQIDKLDKQIESIVTKLKNPGKGFGDASLIRRLREQLIELRLTKEEAQKALIEVELTKPAIRAAANDPVIDKKKAAAEAERQRKANARYLKQLDRRFAALDYGLSSEYDRIRIAEEKKVALINEYDEKGVLAAAEKEYRLNLIHAAASRQRLALARRERQTNLSATVGMFAALASVMRSGSRKEFERSKKVATAGARIKGYQAVVNSYEAGSKIAGPIMGAAFAVIAALAVEQQVKNIKNQTIDGGGAFNFSGGGIGTSPTAPTPPAPPGTAGGIGQGNMVYNFTFIGDSYGFDNFKDKVTSVIKSAVNADDILIPPDSRNGIELRDSTA